MYCNLIYMQCKQKGLDRPLRQLKLYVTSYFQKKNDLQSLFAIPIALQLRLEIWLKTVVN